jgi:hypothetical protein
MHTIITVILLSIVLIGIGKSVKEILINFKNQ